MDGRLSLSVAVHVELLFEGQVAPQFKPVHMGVHMLVVEVEERVAFQCAYGAKEICLFSPRTDALGDFAGLSQRAHVIAAYFPVCFFQGVKLRECQRQGMQSYQTE